MDAVVIGDPAGPGYAIVVVDSDLAAPGRRECRGEICVAGQRPWHEAYLNRPELTAGPLLSSNPDLPGQRLLPLRRISGRPGPGRETLIYLGRVDDQTKVRGFIALRPAKSKAVDRSPAWCADAAVRADGRGTD